MNAVTLRESLARSREMSVDLATLAKLAVFERGTDAAAVQLLYRTVMDEASDRKLLLPDHMRGGTELPPEWKRHEPFVDQWLEMEPIFEDPAGLRAAMFLSRDVMAPAMARSGMSEAARAAVPALLAIASATSPEGKAMADRLNPADRVTVMSALITAMREADWSEKVQGIHGAIILAEASPEARKDFEAFIAGLSLRTIDRGIRYLLKTKGYLGEG